MNFRYHEVTFDDISLFDFENRTERRFDVTVVITYTWEGNEEGDDINDCYAVVHEFDMTTVLEYIGINGEQLKIDDLDPIREQILTSIDELVDDVTLGKDIKPEQQ